MFIIKTIDGEVYASMLPDVRRDPDTDAMRIRIFFAIKALQPVDADEYRKMLEHGERRLVFLAEPQSGLES